MTYLVVLSNRDDFIQSLNTLFASKEVVVSQAKNLTELKRVYDLQAIHLVIYDERTKLNLDHLNQDIKSPSLGVLPFIVIHHQINEIEYYYQLGVLNVIGVEQYVGILPKLVATCMLHMDVKLRARMFDMKEQPQSAKGNHIEDCIDQIPKIIKKFIFKEPITIEFLANQLNISRRHLLRKINDRYDMTAIDLISNVKIGICHEMLQSNQYSIDEVCSLLGFKSPYYFKKKYEKYLKSLESRPINTIVGDKVRNSKSS